MIRKELINSSDVVIVEVPHFAYKELIIPENVEVVDLWGATKKTPNKE